MREDLEREVVSRLSVSEEVVKSLLTGRTAGAGQAQTQLAHHQLGAGERTERAFLELCIALPQRGHELLEALDLEVLFTSPLIRAAAVHLRRHLEHPTSEIDDAALASLLAELDVRAAALTPVQAELEAERCQLELARINGAILAGRGAVGGSVTELQHERAELMNELDGWLAEALDQTAAGRA
jgi:hypothetical protein